MSRSDVQVAVDGTDWPTRDFIVTWSDDELTDHQIQVRVNGTTLVVGTVEGVRAFATHLLATADHVEASR